VTVSVGSVARLVERIGCFVLRHSWKRVLYVSPAQPTGVNCIGDDWYTALRCERCGTWRDFRAGRNFLRVQSWQPLLDAMRPKL
jgi:hypothetical protein